MRAPPCPSHGPRFCERPPGRRRRSPAPFHRARAPPPLRRSRPLYPQQTLAARPLRPFLVSYPLASVREPSLLAGRCPPPPWRPRLILLPPRPPYWTGAAAVLRAAGRPQGERCAPAVLVVSVSCWCLLEPVLVLSCQPLVLMPMIMSVCCVEERNLTRSKLLASKSTKSSTQSVPFFISNNVLSFVGPASAPPGRTETNFNFIRV